MAAFGVAANQLFGRPIAEPIPSLISPLIVDHWASSEEAGFLNVLRHWREGPPPLNTIGHWRLGISALDRGILSSCSAWGAVYRPVRQIRLCTKELCTTVVYNGCQLHCQQIGGGFGRQYMTATVEEVV